ncbi:hypothetical protein HPG69_010657 [Diceros bicornis minor]|uniref:Immunoglobulin domain-containing protein n=1 Tax=Diceros bicornis minor TaxID=77932 RepID=A0A7J7EX19_DICBM|nr:hypothetical protein HPG69_010657 [Diceros bicornis minor]
MSSTPLMVDGVLGESVTLPLECPTGEEIDSITWLHSGSSITVIRPNKPSVLVTAPKWKDRLHVIQSYSLQLSNLMMADAGSYSIRIGTNTSSVFSSYTLRIFSSKAVIGTYCPVTWILLGKGLLLLMFLAVLGTWHIQTHVFSKPLICSVEEGGENVIYGWTSMGPGAIVSQGGSILNDSWIPDDLDQNYACTAVNPLLRRPQVTLESTVFENRVCNAVLKRSLKGGGEIMHTGGDQLCNLDQSNTCTALNPVTNNICSPCLAALSRYLTLLASPGPLGNVLRRSGEC